MLRPIRQAMSARVVAVANHINYVRVNNPEKETCTDNVQVNSNNICSPMEVITAGGWLALKIRMADGSEWVSPIAEFHEAYAPNSAHVFAQTNVLVRAAWNYAIVSFDGSWGAHNPMFIRDPLIATLNASR